MRFKRKTKLNELWLQTSKFAVDNTYWTFGKWIVINKLLLIQSGAMLGGPLSTVCTLVNFKGTDWPHRLIFSAGNTDGRLFFIILFTLSFTLSLLN